MIAIRPTGKMQRVHELVGKELPRTNLPFSLVPWTALFFNNTRDRFTSRFIVTKKRVLILPNKPERRLTT